MREIFLHQLHDNFKSLRFQAGLVALLAFFGANGGLYMLKGDRVSREVERLESENARRYEQVTDVGSILGIDFRFLLRPLGTEFIAEGGSHWFPDTGLVNASTGGFASNERRAAVNHWMDRFEVLDWVLVARVVLSFLAIVLAYDAFSGERETGTLSMLLSNPVSRLAVLGGKFCAHLAALVSALLLGILVSLAILSLSSTIVLDARVAAAAGLFVLGAALYCALFLLVALGVSALARSSASALVLLVLLWAVLIVALPQAAYLVGLRAVPAPEWNRVDGYREQVDTALSREGLLLRGRREGAADGHAVEKAWAVRMREEEKVLQQMRRGFQDLETRQYDVTRAIALLSPGQAFQATVESLLGTGIVRHHAFVAATRRYLDALRGFVRARDAADPASPHVLYVVDYLSQQPVDHRDIPRFSGVRLSMSDALASGWRPLALLLLEALAASLFAAWAATRAEVVDRS